ncbi:ATP-grasp domain-containing protein [Haloechinothrix sp. LS1_15]|uniref:ATP-grasp domain-containing protein n=1 Tax=Haloechinothrix sp. LS1_15 TaxID=2652248 RepID=UPI002945DE17|nr:ATP-grasp domain-containing protein [Haloechinothrix sp. LS1_15]MDV6013414.1 ATP-grasp domain-containing protein [Haloechinothrix sp. LS1_15]
MATLLMIESWMRSTGQALPGVIARLGHRYVLFTRDPDLYPASQAGAPHPVVAGAETVVRVDTNDLDALVAEATSLARRERIDGVLTTCDYYLEAVATVAEALRLPGPPAEVMRLATRKHRVRQALAEAGVAGPRFAVASGWEECLVTAAEIGYPLVAKPTDRNAGTAVRRVDGEAALKDAFWEITGDTHNTRGQPLERVVLLEELLDGPEVSVEAVTCHGGTTIVGVTDKSVTGPPSFVESGHMFPADLDPDAATGVEDHVRRALDALGFTHGLSHTEVKLTAHGPRIVEINPRQAGGYIFELIHLVTGTHPLEILIELSLGHVPSIGTDTAPVLSAEPPAASAAIMFLLSPRDGTVIAVDGTERLVGDPTVTRWTAPVPTRVRYPRSNDDYLGHVVAVDHHGRRARALAERAVGGLLLRFDDGDAVAPAGVPSGVVAR